MYRFAIVDDVREVNDHIKNLLLDKFQDGCYIKTFNSAEELNRYDESAVVKDYDIVFMDIVLAEESGIDLAIEYEKKHPLTKFIFITGYVELSPEIFKANPSGLLHKPIEAHALNEVVDRVLKKNVEQDLNTIIIESKDTIYKISIEDIKYIESEGHHIFVNYRDEALCIRMKLTDLLALIISKKPTNCFIRCHQSYVVNAKYISSFGKKDIILYGDIVIPISKTKHSDAKKEYIKYLADAREKL